MPTQYPPGYPEKVIGYRVKRRDEGGVRYHQRHIGFTHPHPTGTLYARDEACRIAAQQRAVFGRFNIKVARVRLVPKKVIRVYHIKQIELIPTVHNVKKLSKEERVRVHTELDLGTLNKLRAHLNPLGGSVTYLPETRTWRVVGVVDLEEIFVALGGERAKSLYRVKRVRPTKKSFLIVQVKPAPLSYVSQDKARFLFDCKELDFAVNAEIERRIERLDLSIDHIHDHHTKVEYLVGSRSWLVYDLHTKQDLERALDDLAVRVMPKPIKAT